MTGADRCEAMLKNGRQEGDRWEWRCKHRARPESAFCGSHAWLAEFITHVEWKEDKR